MSSCGLHKCVERLQGHGGAGSTQRQTSASRYGPFVPSYNWWSVPEILRQAESLGGSASKTQDGRYFLNPCPSSRSITFRPTALAPEVSATPTASRSLGDGRRGLNLPSDFQP
ncbi:hypothetical protein C8R44DRAFT_745290 [Mycena epipterygia]|nr:hypothetical protein C8R44DRAFT_745290 [Mycena epipterygia]